VILLGFQEFFAASESSWGIGYPDEGMRIVSLGVCSLSVPMSPGLVNVRMWAHIAQGLISTERKHSQDNYLHAFCVLPYFTSVLLGIIPVVFSVSLEV
jgi:hypothetical protein